MNVWERLRHNFFEDGEPYEEVSVEGFVDAKGIRYIGKAAKQPDGKWICLADVGGALCRVEVTISFGPKPDSESV